MVWGSAQRRRWWALGVVGGHGHRRRRPHPHPRLPNDPATLDRAAIRTGRFDAIVDVGYPTRSDAARILTALLAGLPGAEDVDPTAVVAALPEQTGGGDLCEIVRRAVLSSDIDQVSTVALLAEVGSGRYRPTNTDGMYL